MTQRPDKEEEKAPGVDFFFEPKKSFLGGVMRGIEVNWWFKRECDASFSRRKTGDGVQMFLQVFDSRHLDVLQGALMNGSVSGHDCILRETWIQHFLCISMDYMWPFLSFSSFVFSPKKKQKHVITHQFVGSSTRKVIYRLCMRTC